MTIEDPKFPLCVADFDLGQDRLILSDTDLSDHGCWIDLKTNSIQFVEPSQPQSCFAVYGVQKISSIGEAVSFADRITQALAISMNCVLRLERDKSFRDKFPVIPERPDVESRLKTLCNLDSTTSRAKFS